MHSLLLDDDYCCFFGRDSGETFVSRGVVQKRSKMGNPLYALVMGTEDVSRCVQQVRRDFAQVIKEMEIH
jgi:hypothetical protein